jgi:hypothetical protein
VDARTKSEHDISVRTAVQAQPTCRQDRVEVGECVALSSAQLRRDHRPNRPAHIPPEAFPGAVFPQLGRVDAARSIERAPIDGWAFPCFTHQLLAKEFQPFPPDEQIRVLETQLVHLFSQAGILALQGRYKVAVVISNDSDLATPIRMVKDELGLKVGVMLPLLHNNKKRHPSRELTKRDTATFVKRISEQALKNSLFPPIVQNTIGPITKPTDW